MKPVDKRMTKDEILSAYQNLHTQMTSPTTAPTLPIPSVKTATTSLQKTVDALAAFKTSLEQLITTLHTQKQTQLEDEQRSQSELHEFQEDMKRAKEELEYELKRNRKEQTDELNAQLAAKRREHDEELRQERLAIQVQKDELATQTQELKDLRQQVSQFPQKLEKDIASAVNAARQEEQTTAKIAHELLEKQLEGERAVKELKIATLEQTAKTQTQEITTFKSQLEQATRQVKDIAVSVIDSHRPLPQAENTQ